MSQQFWTGLPLAFSMVRYNPGVAYRYTIKLISGALAYGAFGVSVTPFFSPSFLAFMHVYGGVLAVPSVRGGSEFGTTWKNAGSKRNKSNTIADFIAAR